MTFFLVRTAVLGCQGLEPGKQSQCRLVFGFVAPADGGHVEGLGILGIGFQQDGQVGQRIVESLSDDLVLD